MSRLCMGTGFLAVGCWLAPVVAQTSTPLVREARAESSPAPKRFELDNGVRVLVVERPGFPFVAAGWAVRTGSADDGADQRGMAHLIEHLLHQGPETLGTRDRVTEKRLLALREDLVDRLERARDRGQSSTVATVARRLSQLQHDIDAVQRKGEGAAIAAAQGITGIDAITERDVTLFYTQVPTNKLELWFWLESDRLAAPVFRDFYGELPIVLEELRERVESRPAAEATARFDARFWSRSEAGAGYGWPAGGVEADLLRMRPRAAYERFRQSYVPANIVVALVGDVDSKAAAALARAYFGRLEPSAPNSSETKAPFVRRDSSRRAAPFRIEEPCECRPRAHLRWSSARAGSDLESVYDLLAAVLNGRTGRLHQQLVIRDRAAFAAYAQHSALGRGGEFSLVAEALERADGLDEEPDLEQLSTQLLATLRELATHPVSEQELRRVRVRMRTEHARNLESNQGLLLQLLAREAISAGDRVFRRDEQLAAITPRKLQELAAELLAREPSRVLLRREQP